MSGVISSRSGIRPDKTRENPVASICRQAQVLLGSFNMKKSKKKSTGTVKSQNVPAIVELLNEVRNELIHRIERAKTELKSDIHGIKADIRHVTALIEEQNARNVIVLDGLNVLFARQERIERKCGS